MNFDINKKFEFDIHIYYLKNLKVISKIEIPSENLRVILKIKNLKIILKIIETNLNLLK